MIHSFLAFQHTAEYLQNSFEMTLLNSLKRGLKCNNDWLIQSLVSRCLWPQSNPASEMPFHECYTELMSWRTTVHWEAFLMKIEQKGNQDHNLCKFEILLYLWRTNCICCAHRERCCVLNSFGPVKDCFVWLVSSVSTCYSLHLSVFHLCIRRSNQRWLDVRSHVWHTTTSYCRSTKRQLLEPWLSSYPGRTGRDAFGASWITLKR